MHIFYTAVYRVIIHKSSFPDSYILLCFVIFKCFFSHVRYVCVNISTVKRLSVYKIKVFVYIIYVCCTVYIYYLYLKTHTFSIYFENINVYIFI